MHSSGIFVGYKCAGESCCFRDWNLNAAWRNLFKLRWPDLINQIQPTDWQQAYWETHLQKYINFKVLCYFHHLILVSPEIDIFL